MLRRILLPLERRDDEAGAVEFARTLARRRPVELLLLRVEELPLLGPFAVGFALASRACNLARLKARLDGDPGIRATVPLSDAVSAAAVAEQARRRAASLIVLPYHRESAWMRMMHGSSSDRILRESPVPVLAVPGPSRPVNRIINPAIPSTSVAIALPERRVIRRPSIVASRPSRRGGASSLPHAPASAAHASSSTAFGSMSANLARKNSTRHGDRPTPAS